MKKMLPFVATTAFTLLAALVAVALMYVPGNLFTLTLF